jgi:hypothetical protein
MSSVWDALFTGNCTELETMTASRFRTPSNNFPHYSPLHFAAKDKMDKAMRVMINRGGFVFAAAENGKSPLSLLMATNQWGLIDSHETLFKTQYEDAINGKLRGKTLAQDAKKALSDILLMSMCQKRLDWFKWATERGIRLNYADQRGKCLELEEPMKAFEQCEKSDLWRELGGLPLPEMIFSEEDEEWVSFLKEKRFTCAFNEMTTGQLYYALMSSLKNTADWDIQRSYQIPVQRVQNVLNELALRGKLGEDEKSEIFFSSIFLANILSGGLLDQVENWLECAKRIAGVDLLSVDFIIKKEEEPDSALSWALTRLGKAEYALKKLNTPGTVVVPTKFAKAIQKREDAILIARALARAGADIGFQYKSGKTLPHLMVGYDSYEGLKLLHELGSPHMNHRPSYKKAMTPLETAQKQGKKEIALFLESILLKEAFSGDSKKSVKTRMVL